MICSHEDCEDEVPQGRAALGYRTCLEHGAAKREFPTAIPYAKGAYQLITRADLKSLGRKTEAD